MSADLLFQFIEKGWLFANWVSLLLSFLYGCLDLVVVTHSAGLRPLDYCFLDPWATWPWVTCPNEWLVISCITNFFSSLPFPGLWPCRLQPWSPSLNPELVIHLHVITCVQQGDNVDSYWLWLWIDVFFFTRDKPVSATSLQTDVEGCGCDCTRCSLIFYTTISSSTRSLPLAP